LRYPTTRGGKEDNRRKSEVKNDCALGQWLLSEAFPSDKAVETRKRLLRVDNIHLVHSLPLYHPVFHTDVWPKNDFG
jgi:hypothetical protein